MIQPYMNLPPTTIMPYIGRALQPDEIERLSSSVTKIITNWGATEVSSSYDPVTRILNVDYKEPLPAEFINISMIVSPSGVITQQDTINSNNNNH
jgi:hypothetical protein